MASIKSKIVEAEDPRPLAEEAVAIFVRAGWPALDAEWLGPACLAALPKRPEPEGLDDVTEHNLVVAADARNHAGAAGGRDRALLLAFARMCCCGGRNADWWTRSYPPHDPACASPLPEPGLEQWEALAAEIRRDRDHAKGADLEHALALGGWPGDYGTERETADELQQFVRSGPRIDFRLWPTLIRLMHVLVYSARIDLAKVVDPDVLAAQGQLVRPGTNDHPRVPKDRVWTPPNASNPRLLSTWLCALGPPALTQVYPLFRARPNGEMAFGIRDDIERWVLSRAGHPTYFQQAGPELGSATRQYADDLEQLCATCGPSSDTLLRRAWLWFSWCTFESDPLNLQSERRERLLRAATEDLARLRPLLRRARPKLASHTPAVSPGGSHPAGGAREPWEEFAWESDHFRVCVILLCRFGGVWRSMKPLLLALRALATPSVAIDLRYWREDRLEPPPEPWSTIPESMISLFHSFARNEERHDPGLQALRGNLASFCLERLVDRLGAGKREEAVRSGRRRTDEEMVEPSPDWRYCLVRAVTTLGVNPAGAGHRALHAASAIDPNPDVREAARDAYERLRRGADLPPNVSPRRAVISALWWIRQGHLLGLGIQPDPDGAQRTRLKEMTHTKEAERADKPALRND